MKLVVISPEGYEPREHAVLAGLFAAGLERYHIRKPQWARHILENFIRVIPDKWRSRLVLHEEHDLANEFGCGGVHFKDSDAQASASIDARPDGAKIPTCLSRSCHALSTLKAALGNFDSVFFSPVFPSISKPGYTPSIALKEVRALLERRTATQRKTQVIALGGVTPANVGRCREMGFDGVAVLGSIWQSSEPRKVFEQLQHALSSHAA